MDDPEVIMRDATRSSDLLACSKALDAAGAVLQLVTGVPTRLRCLADQAVRAASSVPANLAEGHGRSGKDRTYHWRIAYGSAKEVDCHLRLLARAGAVDAAAANEALQAFDEVRAMTWRLLHPAR